MRFWLFYLLMGLLTACGGGGGSSGSSNAGQPPSATPDKQCSSEELLLCLVGNYQARHQYFEHSAPWERLTVSEEGDFNFHNYVDLSFAAEQIIAVSHSNHVISLRVQMSDHEKTFLIYTDNNLKNILDIEYSHEGIDYGVVLSELPSWKRTPGGQVGNGVSATIAGVLQPIYRTPDDAISHADHDGLLLTVSENQIEWLIHIDDQLADSSYVCGPNSSLKLQWQNEVYSAEQGECLITITSYELKSNGEIDYIDARFVAQLKPSASNHRWLRVNDGIFRFDVN